MKSINRPELVREHNLDIVRGAIYKARRATRQELTALTGISTVTLGSLLQDLLQSGEVYEGETEPSQGGRPVHVYCYNPESLHGLYLMAQFEAGCNVFKAGMIDRYGAVVHERKRRTEHMGPRQTTACLQDLTEQSRPVGVMVVGLPGVGYGRYFREDAKSQILSLPALNVFFEDRKIPVILENDINLAALGYTQCCLKAQKETIAYFYFMRNCYAGSSLCIEGRVHRGKGRFAGELPTSVYGVNWKEADTVDRSKICQNLLRVFLSYVSILAPDRIVVASDYVDSDCLRETEAKISALLGQEHCPKLVLTTGFDEDYARGVRGIALEKISVGEPT